MKKERNPYQIFNEYYLRTPLFSISDYQKIIEKDDLLDEDITSILSNPTFREALQLASPDLLLQIERWENGLLKDNGKIEKLKISVLKYFTRISSRCTPFGLFASCSLGKFGTESNVNLQEIAQYKRVTSFDYTFLSKLSLLLLQDEQLKNQSLFYVNSSLYRIGDHYRYTEYTIKNNRREYSLEGVQFSPYIEKILTTAKQGATLNQLAQLIVEDDITYEEAISFVEELVQNQILISEFALNVTGEEYLERLLKTIPEHTEIYPKLLQLKKELTRLDSSFENSEDTYNSIISLSKKIIPNLNKNYLFQTNTFSSTHQNTLDSSLKRKLYKALKIFNKITLPTANGKLLAFKQAFVKRYQDQELPLLMVLDPEIGIGFGDKKDNNTPLLNGIPSFPKLKRYERTVWTDYDSIISQKLHHALLHQDKVIQLSDDDFLHIPEQWTDLPNTLSSLIEVYNNTIYIKSIGGSSAINLLGRFTSGDDELHEYVQKVYEFEQQSYPDKIVAEIVHLPEDRTGNILHRKNLRTYEIPYLGNSTLPITHQIPSEDMTVSVINNRIILKSKTLNKEILPRLSNAHNYGYNSLSVYHFLAELQTQSQRAAISFNWNTIFLKLSYLPRVEYDSIILSKARWLIATETIRDLITGDAILEKVKLWQQQLRLPDYVELVRGDNTLLIYLKNKLSVQMLLHTVKNKKQFILQEFLFDSDEIVTKNGKSYTNQCVVSFFNAKKVHDEYN